MAAKKTTPALGLQASTAIVIGAEARASRPVKKDFPHIP
jgi:hypothetical protein